MRITGTFALSLVARRGRGRRRRSELRQAASRQRRGRRWRGPRGQLRGGQQAEGRAPRRSQGGNVQVGDEARRGHGAGQDRRSRRSTKPRIDKARQDPGKQQRIRDEMARELTAVKKSFTKFEGQKTGWDVSIIGPEFQQNTAEAVLVTKEDIWTRYFFFFEDGLYKMFLAFNKDAIGGKSFQEFGKGMEAKYGHAKEVYRDDKIRGGVTPHARSLRVVGGRRRPAEADRSVGVLRRLLPGALRRIGSGPRRRAAQGRQPRRGRSSDELVEAVTGQGHGSKGSDIDDDIIDRVVGKEIKKPGDRGRRRQDIVVDSSNLPQGHERRRRARRPARRRRR